MVIRTFKLASVAMLLAFAVASPGTARSGERDLVCSIAIIPGAAELPGRGGFVDLAKAMSEIYTDGKITIELFPFARSVNNVVNGQADFHIPNRRIPQVDESKLPYRFAAKSYGSVYHVIYSNTARKITKQMLDDAIAKWRQNGTPFPYQIEVAGGVEKTYPFPAIPNNDRAVSLKKLSAGRIDAVVGAQEDCDTPLRTLKLGNIQRAEWNHYQETITVARSPRGDKVDQIVSDLLTKLEQSGKLKEIYARIHLPYDDWQPSTMNWPASNSAGW